MHRKENRRAHGTMLLNGTPLGRTIPPMKFRPPASWPLLLLAVLLGGLGCAACSPAGGPRRAFYHWKTVFAPTGEEKALLTRHHIDRLYIRLFDVDWHQASGKPLPEGRCRFDTPVPPGIEIVPVVYLTNAVFLNEPAPKALAQKVWKLTRAMSESAGFIFGEMQVDCDWTDTTRAPFFEFCTALRALCRAKEVKLSATIRLHQVKYRSRTGTPPVDRGLVMFYNVGAVEARPRRTSIFNAEDAARYTPWLKSYPLPVDAALAIFSWAVHARDGQVVGLLEKVSATDLHEAPGLREKAPGLYVATVSAFFHGRYLRQGDTLALESMTPARALESARMLAAHLPPDPDRTLALFDIDEKNVRDYAPQDLDALFRCFR